MDDDDGGWGDSIGVMGRVLIYIPSSSLPSWYILGLLLDIVEWLGDAVMLG